MVSEALEVSASALACDRVVFNFDFGAGGISGGNFRDQDFLVSGRLFSDSISPVTNDDLLYFNVDLGWRFYEAPNCSLDGLVGYQFWRERNVAEGGASIVPGTANFPAVPVITEQFTWQGLRIGAQGVVQFSPRWSVRARLLFLPVTHFEMKDVHHLRPDLLQDPSVIDRATGGFGVIAEARFCYWLWRGLFLELGYRIWDVTSGDGAALIRATTGATELPLNGANTTRQGLVLGLNYQF
jgi:hypothetical protein